MTIDGWQITSTPDAIICERDRVLRIPLSNGQPRLDWRSGFGALNKKGQTTWMAPDTVRRILEAVE